jgi:DNA-binding PadR family transcriptional regulator
MQVPAHDGEEFLPLTPAVFHILLSLADGERHGYRIMRDISAHTKGKLRLGPATLYRSIKHLVEDGLIEESNVRPDPALDDERRHYYRLTEFGRQVLVAELRRLEEALAVARTKRGLRDLLPAPSIEEAR